MTQGQWNTVMVTNALLHASYVRLLREGTVCKVERAMYPAFKLKPRLLLDFNASKDNNDIKIPPRNLFIPRYRVEDDSYVEVSENKSSVASAIASSSLSETAAEVAVGGGAFGYSAGMQAGFKKEEAASNDKKESNEKQKMTITYNFPRVVLQLDEESLELTGECANSLEHVTDKESVAAFKARYGTFFATRVELGGRLHATEDSDALAEKTVSARSKAMKASASLSFSSPWVQGSASASHASANAQTDDKSKSSMNKNMTWEAKGGDTLLCNNPPAWCSTVASFYNWRVVKQENLLSIEDVIAKIPGHEHVKDRFLKFTEDKQEGRSKGTVRVRFKLPGAFYATLQPNPNDAISKKLRRKAEGMQKTFHVMDWLNRNAKDWRAIVPQKEGGTVFRLHGTVTTNTNGEKRLIAGGAYTICSETENTYLQGTSTIPETQLSYFHDGANETAWIFTMKRQKTTLEAEAALEPGECVQVGVSDDRRKEVGVMGYNFLAGMGDYCLGVSNFGPVDAILEYVP
ncbi:unnamed protein product [Penicillium pancosmium]